MTRTQRCLAFAVLLITYAALAQARQPYDGSAIELARFASTYERTRAAGVGMPEESEDVGFFKCFVQGVFVTQKWSCARAPISMEQVWAVVAKYIREHAERWGIEARDLVIEASDRVRCHVGAWSDVGGRK